LITLNNKSLQLISDKIADKFDRLISSFLGLEAISKNKRIVLSAKPKSLSSLFISSLGRAPSSVEKTALQGILKTANGYVEAIKNQTIAKIMGDINGYMTEQVLGEQEGSITKIQNIISNELKNVSKKLEVVVGAESNKSINMATALKIKKIGEERGIDDPTVAFIVTVDDVTGDEEFILHLLPDKKTPRAWKLSELKGSFHKRGEPNPSLCGLHTWCRCSLVTIMPGYGFNEAGKIVYKGPDYDVFKEQREKYGLPR
jgi:hypothetical protein